MAVMILEINVKGIKLIKDWQNGHSKRLKYENYYSVRKYLMTLLQVFSYIPTAKSYLMMTL